MVSDDNKNEWFDELAGGLRGFKRYKPVKNTQVKSPTKSLYTYNPDLIDVMRIAKRLPQALIKVSGFAQSIGQVSACLSYISRDGELTLENEQGDEISNLGEQEDELNAWLSNFDENGRNTAHLIMSLPSKSDRDKTLKAARHFLKQEFAEKGYQYVFTAHDDTEHPHVHACIKMRGEMGKKLTFRKAELHQLRRNFAEVCRKQGIEVEASFRYERGLIGKSMKSSIAQLRKQNKAPKADIELLDKVRQNYQQQQIQASREMENIILIDSNNRKDSFMRSWQDRALRQRQLIQQQFKECAQELYLKSQQTDELDMREVLLQSAQEVLSYSKELPHIDTRYDELQLAIELVEDDSGKVAEISQEAQQKIVQDLTETLAQATKIQNADGVWQEALSPLCQQLLEQKETTSLFNEVAKHVRQPPVFIDTDKKSAVLAIGHEKYVRLTLVADNEEDEQKLNAEPIYQNQVDNVKCEVFSAAKVDHAVLLAALTLEQNKEDLTLDKAIYKDLQTVASIKLERVREKELALEQELEIDWDD